MYVRPLDEELKLDRPSGVEADVEGLALRCKQLQCVTALLTDHHVLAETSNFRQLNHDKQNFKG